jgi:hypothetical protein
MQVSFSRVDEKGKLTYTTLAIDPIEASCLHTSMSRSNPSVPGYIYSHFPSSPLTA